MQFTKTFNGKAKQWAALEYSLCCRAAQTVVLIVRTAFTLERLHQAATQLGKKRLLTKYLKGRHKTFFQEGFEKI